MSDYIAAPLSRQNLLDYAKTIRVSLNLEDRLCFPVLSFLEILPDFFSVLGFTFEIVPDSEFPNAVQGETDVTNHHIRIKESVYNGAYNGNGRDRYSIMHEISHYLLMSVSGVTFQRNISGRKVKTYEDPEWQAECLAAELLMPFDLVREKSIQEIANDCKVSFAAARTQSKYLK